MYFVCVATQERQFTLHNLHDTSYLATKPNDAHHSILHNLINLHEISSVDEPLLCCDTIMSF